MAGSKDKGLTVHGLENYGEQNTDVISLTKRESFLAPHVPPHIPKMPVRYEYEKLKWAV